MNKTPFQGSGLVKAFHKVLRLGRDLHLLQRGVTGVETAVVITSLVGASSFLGYSLVNAGDNSSERVQEAVTAGIDQVNTHLKVSGSVLALSDDNNQLSSIVLTVTNYSAAGKSIDMTPNNGTDNNTTIISMVGSGFYLKDVNWTCNPVGKHNGNRILESDEQFMIKIDLTNLGGFGVTQSADPCLARYDTFTVQITPAQGSTLSVKRTLPAAIYKVNDLG